MYPEHITKPCEEQLTTAGFKALKTSEDVTEVLAQKEGTTLLVINSVCGCAAANARPAALASIQHAKHPTNLVTVFAGVDSDAVAKAREFTFPYPPSRHRLRQGHAQRPQWPPRPHRGEWACDS